MITKPAIVAPKLRMALAVAGAAGGGLARCLPPTPSAMIKMMRTGTHATRSYQLSTLYPPNEI